MQVFRRNHANWWVWYHTDSCQYDDYYSNGYDLEKRKQSEARIDRIGQKFPMTYIDIMAEDTVDERIVKALRKKVNIASKIMGEELKAWI